VSEIVGPSFPVAELSSQPHIVPLWGPMQVSSPMGFWKLADVQPQVLPELLMFPQRLSVVSKKMYSASWPLPS